MHRYDEDDHPVEAEGVEVVTEQNVRRFAHVMSLTAELEYLKTVVRSMDVAEQSSPKGGYPQEAYLQISVRMEAIAKELRAIGGAECPTNGSVGSVGGS